MKLIVKIRFNREIDSVDDVISIGSFGVNIGSKEVIFDMMDSAIYIDKKDGTLVTYEGWNVDVESFPDSALLDDAYRYINTLTRVNVNTEDVSLYPVKVEEFIFMPGKIGKNYGISQTSGYISTDNKYEETKFSLSRDILDRYNESLSLKHMVAEADRLDILVREKSFIIDGDTILKDQIDSLLDEDYTGIFREIIGIWNYADTPGEKRIAERIFETFTGMKFQDYIAKCIEATK